MAETKKSVNLLPEYLRTDKNSKFLSSTIDQLIQTPQVERVDGYVGSKITPNYDPTTDYYLNENSKLRKSYNLDPALVFKDSTDNVTDVVSYDDLINELKIQGAPTDNLDALFRSKFYAYDPLIDWDKLINYTDYYWLPVGPDLILINDENLDVTEIIGSETYTTEQGYTLTNGLRIGFVDNTIQTEYRRKEFIVEGVGHAIKLVDLSLLTSSGVFAQVFNETFDDVSFDSYPFDGDKTLPLTPDYITINRASQDLNSWSRYNRWFHKDVIRISAEINNIPVVYPLSSRAQRPIIEFKADLQLYNYGKVGIENVDLIDTDTKDAFNTVDGSYGYYIDEVLLQQGHRIIFNADANVDVRGRIYEVDFDLTGEVPILRLIELVDNIPSESDSVSINLGSTYYGTNWYFDSSKLEWIYAQQHTKLNQPPLFDLFTSNGVSYTQLPEANTFKGSQIFGYDIGTGVNDIVLGFPLKYQNTVGVGSYLFKNYFMSDTISLVSNNVSNEVSTGIAFLKINDELVNVWVESADYRIPILEVQTVAESTNTLSLTCLDLPIDTNLTVSAFINNKKIPISVNASTAEVIITTTSTFLTNSTIVFKIVTEQVPNNNGYYEPPISLTNNPLNESITNFTLGELSDHLSSMLARFPGYDGSGLRDLIGYTNYGSRLVINETPISFAHIFIGKKEHNVVDAIRQAGDHYNQFKMNFLRAINNVDSSLSPADALDQVLLEINKSKDLKSPYYRSDMLAYGNNKTRREYTVTSINNVEYPIGFEFDLTRLSFQSVLVYLNDVQLLHFQDYTFDYINGSITILATLEIDDVIAIDCYPDTLGCYIPPTPTKLGLFPATTPVTYVDATYATSTVNCIIGHDISRMTIYNDYRDNIILEFEKRVYNNIKVKNDNDIFNTFTAQPGAFRSKNYTLEDLNRLLETEFSKWAGQYNIDTSSNTGYRGTNYRTWNHINSVDRIFNEPKTGSWKALFRYFYDSFQPNNLPWQMLGFIRPPNWWVSEYGVGPYTSSNTKLWTDLRDGYIRGEDKYNIEYARPDLLSIIPVNASGVIKFPTNFLVTDNTRADKTSPWKFGDIGPAENAWRRSSYFPFALNAAIAVLDPCSYCSKLYDVSRSYINITGQVLSNLDNLYFNPKKLLIDGEDDSQIAGYGVYVTEIGKQKDQNYIKKLRQDIDYLNFNLFHKLGGFVSKEKLQITIDSIDPTSTSPGVILPSEDYSLILNTSNPIKSSRISGMIVQKSNGNFVIKGYDISNPYFEILKPIKTLAGSSVKVGGVSEDFTDWSNVSNNGNKGLSSVDLVTANSSTTRYYKQGQLVRYNGQFYRVKTGHNAESTFDASLYQRLPELPVVGGASAQLPTRFESTITQIPYGSEFTTVQDVYDVIVGYGAYLESQGFIFDEFNSDLNEILNWKYTGKEFLYWTTQNWADGNLITLSPFANHLKYSFPDSVVDNISTGKYEYSLLKADGKPYPIDKFTMAREDAICTIKTTDSYEGIFFAKLNSIQKEHAIVFNNYTMFNDIIYDIETGYRQQRIKLSGFRTKNWNGDLFSPGFVFDNVEITDWQSYKNYLPGAVVRYNGKYYESLVKISADATFDFTKWDQLRSKPTPQLLPNFDYKINQFEDFYSLDIDNFDFGQQQLAQHLTGYTPRTYLNNIFTNPISQYKFYQGFIKDKGTKNAIDKLSKASQYANKGNIEFKEEWAFRIGHYGSFENFNEIEFPLTEGTSLENPYVVKFIDTEPTNNNPLITYVTPDSLLITPKDYTPSNTIDSYLGTWEDTNLKLTTAGYVRLDDVTTTAYNKNSLLDIANNSIIRNGDTIWLGFLENGDWTVYRYANQPAKVTGVFVSAPGSEITFVTDTHHNLEIGDIISIVRFNHQVDGVYVVSSIPTISQFTVASTLSSIENEELLNYGDLYKFENARYSSLDDVAQITNLLDRTEGEKIWVDQGVDNKWQVYEKIKNYTSYVTTSSHAPLNQKFGYSIFASDDTTVMTVSAPNWHTSATASWGRVRVYNKLNDSWVREYDYVLNNYLKAYCSSSSSTQFGYALQYDIGKKLFITGAPAASYVRSTGTELISTGTGFIKSFVNEGLVKISSRPEEFGVENIDVVLVNPKGNSASTANNSRFGHSIYINQDASNPTTKLLVSSPGTGNAATFAGVGSVHAYNLSLDFSGDVITLDTIVSPVEILSTSTVSLTAGSQWGYKIAGSTDGSLVAISAPKYSTSTGVVQLFDENLNWKQTITSPFGNYGKFGYDLIVSPSKEYILISAPEIKSLNEPYGKVVIYKATNLTSTGTYTVHQIISNPLSSNDLKFGYALSINKDEDTIAISSLGKYRSQKQLFDQHTNLGQTTFDSDSTTFYETLPDAGTIYLYNKVGDYFIQADELNDVNVLSGSRYGNSVVVTNDSVFVGAPSTAVSEYDESCFYTFEKINIDDLSWKLLREQEDTVETSTVSRVILIDTVKEEITDYLDIIDPVKGKIAGIAEQELKYKAAFDPATYSIGLAGTIVDTTTNWLDDHIGELWWDLSTAKFIWYEQGDEIFRKNNWGKLFPGASIDVYEWVKSDLLPSEWAAQADTTKGLTNGVSGQPKYPDNSVISVKQVFNNVTGSFENVYYFWVKNKVTLPDVKNRRISGYQVASYIADPIANGLKFVEILSPSAMAFANVQPSLIGDRITANISINNNSQIPRHTEWLLLNEGDANSVPNTLLEKKLFDSLLGHDSLGNQVPSPDLTYRNRYGIGIRPQQTLFKDRSSALRNLISFANSVLIKNRIVGNYSFETLNKKEEIPALYSYEYDLIVEDTDALNEVFTINLVQAEIECYANNGKITSAIITNPGYGYTNPPKITIGSLGTTPAEILTEIDNLGRVSAVTITSVGAGYDDGQIVATVRPHTVIVQVNAEYSNKWTKHSFDYIFRTWLKVQTQNYNTTLYWKEVDWVSDNYDSFKVVNYTVSDIAGLSSLVNIQDGDYVTVKNVNDGKYAILQKITGLGDYIPSYNILYKEFGTIQLLDNLWNYSNYTYDYLAIEETLYDQTPDLELYYILLALKNDIFVNVLKINWNLFFFAAVKYAFTEHKLLDWAFKTSFINVTNNVGVLDQQPVYKLNNEQYFEQYINEVKPYHSSIRSYTSVYGATDTANLYSNDFDLPAYYNTETNEYSVVELGNPLLDSYPWKTWADNYKLYVSSIEVGYTGSGYTQRPTVSIAPALGDTGSGATADAYIRNGQLYKIVVTNPGSGYTTTPLISIDGGGNVTSVARVSAVMGNENTRKNIIGMKFDRTSLVGDLTDLTVTEEFICDGETDKFTLTWLASPNKKNITPLLDGKLIFSTDYTIEYYQVKVEHTGIDIDQAFPASSFEGEPAVDHRYRYYFNMDSADESPGYIRHYAKFVFLNQVPAYGQKFKITYTKNIDLYNAVDRINSLYNPKDSMPGKELPMLMSGAEFPGINIQGLPFDQTPVWDGTNTQYDSSPWGEYVDSYTVAKTTLISPLYYPVSRISLDSYDGVTVGQMVRPLGTWTNSHKIFRQDTRVISVNPALNYIELQSLDTSDTQIAEIISTDTTATSVVTIKTKESFHDTISVGDRILVHNVRSLYGYGLLSIVPVNIEFTGTVSVIIPPPVYSVPGSRQATAHAIKTLNTVTSVVIDDPGMGYISGTPVSITGTGLLSYESVNVSVDSGFNTQYRVNQVYDKEIRVRLYNTVSSTTTNVEPDIGIQAAYFDLIVENYDEFPGNLNSTSRLIDTVTKTVSTTLVVEVDTYAKYDDCQRLEVFIDNYIVNPYSGPGVFYYTVSRSTDGLNRAIVTLQHADGVSTITGTISVKIFGFTELEFYTHATDYNSLDSLINGGGINSNLITGYNPEDILIDGNNFLNSTDSYAPEECVPGLVRDAVGINVYTVEPESYPIVLTGVFGTKGTDPVTTSTINLLSVDPIGFTVYGNGKTYDRVDHKTDFTTSNQFCIIGNQIIVPRQWTDTRIGYTLVTGGSNSSLDSAYESTTVITEGSTGSIIVSSSLSIDDVRSVYVLLNGHPIEEAIVPINSITTSSYTLSPTSSINNRAAITVYGLPTGEYTVQAWFFDKLNSNFNRVYEQSFTLENFQSASSFTLDLPPGTLEPVSEQIIVEKITSSGRTRLLPPWVSYYEVLLGQTIFAIDPKNSRPGFYNLDNVKVYVNGYELTPGFDFLVDAATQTIQLATSTAGDAVAIMSIVDYDYIVEGDSLIFVSPLTGACTIKVTSFTDHDNMMIRTERFDGLNKKRFVLSYQAINESYVWVTVDSKPLLPGYDYKLLEDLKTIELSEFVEIKGDSDIVVMTVNPPSFGDNILGYRIFKDMFDVHHFTRLSKYFSTTLAESLTYDDDTIIVKDGDQLLQPNPSINLTGAILIDSELIEYKHKDGNVLSGLRRSLLGTGPAQFSDADTKVIDQSVRQKIPTIDYSIIQHIPSSTSTVYTISTVSNTSTFSINNATHSGDGMTLTSVVNAVDQVEVYYGGRRLRKTSLNVHDKSVSYYDSVESITVYPPEFTINTSTQQLTLNIVEEINTGTRITIVQRLGKLWDETTATSLLISTGSQAVFLSNRSAELPDIYYYGGDAVLYENSNVLTDETGEPLEGY